MGKAIWLHGHQPTRGEIRGLTQYLRRYAGCLLLVSHVSVAGRYIAFDPDLTGQRLGEIAQRFLVLTRIEMNKSQIAQPKSWIVMRIDLGHLFIQCERLSWPTGIGQPFGQLHYADRIVWVQFQGAAAGLFGGGKFPLIEIDKSQDGMTFAVGVVVLNAFFRKLQGLTELRA